MRIFLNRVRNESKKSVYANETESLYEIQSVPQEEMSKLFLRKGVALYQFVKLAFFSLLARNFRANANCYRVE